MGTRTIDDPELPDGYHVLEVSDDKVTWNEYGIRLPHGTPTRRPRFISSRWWRSKIVVRADGEMKTATSPAMAT